MTTYDRTDVDPNRAADEIERLQAEVARLREAAEVSKPWMAMAQCAAEEIARLRVEIERLMADKDEALTAAGPVSLQKAKADALDDAWAEIRRLEGERNEALTSNAWWQEEWRLARSERDEALKDAHARMLACEALGVTLDSERKAWEAERARLQEALRSIASHGTTRPWAPGAWDDGDGYWRQVTHALIAAAADALDEREVPTK